MARDSDGFPVLLLAAMPELSLRLGVEFLRLQARRRRGVRRFRRMLLDAGMDHKQAASLAQHYHEVGSVRQLIAAGLGASR